MASDGIAGAWRNIDKVSIPEPNEAYSAWGDTYEEDMAILGYNSPTEGAQKLSSLLANKHTRILDYGCGTGLAARELQSLGCTNIYGVEPVESFVKQCVDSGIYRDAKVLEIDPVPKISYDDDYFDAVISVGVFYPFAANQTAFPEISRVLRSGGYFVNVIRERNYDILEQGMDLKGHYEKFVEDGVWNRLPDVKFLYYTEEELPGLVVTVQKK